MNVFKTAVVAAVVCFGAGAASAASITIQSVGGGSVYASLSYSGADSDIQGYYDGSFTDTLAERYDSGNNASESALVGSIAGIPSLNLGGSELPISSSSTDVAGFTYFTAKFGKSVAVFYNTTSSSINVSFMKDADCKKNLPAGGSKSDCGDISHYKSVTVSPSEVPLPASAVLLLAGLGGLVAMRRRKS